jgi:hypothetical protein
MVMKLYDPAGRPSKSTDKVSLASFTLDFETNLPHLRRANIDALVNGMLAASGNVSTC